MPIEDIAALARVSRRDLESTLRLATAFVCDGHHQVRKTGKGTLAGHVGCSQFRSIVGELMGPTVPGKGGSSMSGPVAEKSHLTS